MRKVSTFFAAATGAAVLGLVGYAYAFPGHWGHHHADALAACVVAAPQSVKTNLWSTFKSSPLRTDREAVWTAKDNLNKAILAKTTPLTPYENALSSARLKMLQDKDALAQNVCGQLSQTQLTAASTLYTNLQSNRQTVRGYFQAAHQAASE